MQWSQDSKILLQGIDAPLAAYYASQMKNYGTKITAAVAPGRGGQSLGDIPIFDLVAEAIAVFSAMTTSLIFVDAHRVLDACLEAMESGIRQLVLITPNVPSLDMVYLLQKAQQTNTIILGPGSQGVLIPEQLWLGTANLSCYSPGKIGLVSRSDRLTDEVALTLTQAGLGQSLMISLGSDSIVGTSLEQWLQVLEEDENTEAIVLVGHPGYSEQILALEYIISALEKPVVIYIPGVQVPIERNLGDATSIITHYLSSSAGVPPLQAQILSRLTSTANLRVATAISAIPEMVKNMPRELSAQKS